MSLDTGFQSLKQPPVIALSPTAKPNLNPLHQITLYLMCICQLYKSPMCRIIFPVLCSSAGRREAFGVAGSFVLLDPEQEANLSKSEILWTFTGSDGKVATILDYVPNHPMDEPSQQFKSRLHFNSSTGSLMLNNLNQSDQGVYSIILDDKLKWRTYLKLIEALSEPSISGNSTCLDTTLELTCRVSAGIASSILWWKDGKVIANGQRYQLMQNNSTLIISKAIKSDCGIYTCTVENPVSKKNAPYSLTLYEALSEPSISGNSTCLDTTIELTCRVSAGIASSILWWKGGKVIANVQRYQLMQNNSTLIISKAMKSDCGIYTCTVENPVSKKNASYSLTLYGLTCIHHCTVAFSRAAFITALATLLTVAATFLDKAPCLNEDCRISFQLIREKMQHFLEFSPVLSFIFLIIAFLCWMQTEVCHNMFNVGTSETDIITTSILLAAVMGHSGHPGITMVLSALLCVHFVATIFSAYNMMTCDRNMLSKILPTKLCRVIHRVPAPMGGIIAICASLILIKEVTKQAGEKCEPAADLLSSTCTALVITLVILVVTFVLYKIYADWKKRTSGTPSENTDCSKTPDEFKHIELKETRLNPGAPQLNN
ncbi:hemicentin-1-like [Scyliorhinus canicula]|uniref:hemicentin-1-like n=1 Tax=Scyliorhinus canicula TaxID=7830 RepID=UPI0018F3DAAB|nr:hemicentin-1-like [Scyliorhinus canicula]